MGVANLSRRQFLAGSAAAGVSLSLDNLVHSHSKTPIPAEFLSMLAALNSIQDKREKVPAEADLKDAEKDLNKLFEAQYKAKKPEFADSLLSGAATEEKTSKRYVMLRDSAQISAENFKLPNSFAALEKLTETYQVKFDAVAGDVLKTAKKGVKSPQQNAEFAELGMSIADLGMKWNDYDAAVKAVNEAKSAAAKSADKSLVDKTNEKLKEVTVLKKEFDEYVKAEDGLSKITFNDTQNDPKKKADFERFNLIAGKWQCFKEDKWNIGIYMLPLGSDKDLASIALKEQKLFESKIPLTAENFYALADDWYGKMKKESDPRDKVKYGGRALHWYDKTLETATGALKTAAETKVKELESFGKKGNIVDLLKMVDPAKDAVAGKWKLEGGKLFSDKSVASARIQLPYQPSEEYDFRVTFTPVEGYDLNIILSKSDHTFAFVMGGWQNTIFGFHLIKGIDARDNSTCVKKERCLENNKSYSAVVEVRNNGIRAYLNGNLICQYQTNYKDLSIPESAKLRDEKSLGLLTTNGTYAIFEKIEILEVKSKGRLK